MTIGLLWDFRICEIGLDFLMNYVFADILHKSLLKLCLVFSDDSVFPSPLDAWLGI